MHFDNALTWFWAGMRSVRARAQHDFGRMRETMRAALQAIRGDTLTFKTEVRYEHIRNGKVIAQGIQHNTISDTGKAQAAKLISGLDLVTFNALAIGTDNTPPAATQTGLIAEITTDNGARQAATISSQMVNVANDTAQFLALWTFSGGPHTIQEAGIFNNATSGGIMLGRVLVGPTTVQSGDSFQITYKITQT